MTSNIERTAVHQLLECVLRAGGSATPSTVGTGGAGSQQRQATLRCGKASERRRSPRGGAAVALRLPVHAAVPFPAAFYGDHRAAFSRISIFANASSRATTTNFLIDSSCCAAATWILRRSSREISTKIAVLLVGHIWTPCDVTWPMRPADTSCGSPQGRNESGSRAFAANLEMLPVR